MTMCRWEFFDLYDQYILNILYHPRIRPGMTREEVRAVIPEIPPQCESFGRHGERDQALAQNHGR